MTKPAPVTAETLIEAIGLPPGCQVDQRVPKKLLVENAASTAADRRQINEGIEEVQWVAALKPNTIGVAAYRDEQREYLEIAVLVCKLRPMEARHPNAARIAELIHRAVPYPVFLFVQMGQEVELSLAHKRWAQNEASKMVLDGDPMAVVVTQATAEAGEESIKAFVRSLALTSQPQQDLWSVYEGWMASIQGLLAAKVTGTFSRTGNPEQTTARHQALREYKQLELEMSRLRSLAAKEKQMARQVELNLALKRIEEQLAAIRKQLKGNTSESH